MFAQYAENEGGILNANMIVCYSASAKIKGRVTKLEMEMAGLPGEKLG